MVAGSSGLIGPSRTARSGLEELRSSSEKFLRRLRNTPNQRPNPRKPRTPTVTVVAVMVFVVVGKRLPLLSPPPLDAAGSTAVVELVAEVGRVPALVLDVSLDSDVESSSVLVVVEVVSMCDDDDVERVSNPSADDEDVVVVLPFSVRAAEVFVASLDEEFVSLLDSLLSVVLVGNVDDDEVVLVDEEEDGEVCVVDEEGAGDELVPVEEVVGGLLVVVGVDGGDVCFGLGEGGGGLLLGEVVVTTGGSVEVTIQS